MEISRPTAVGPVQMSTNRALMGMVYLGTGTEVASRLVTAVTARRGANVARSGRWTYSADREPGRVFPTDRMSAEGTCPAIGP